MLDEFLTHGRAVRAERARAAAAGEAPDFVSLVRQWGGVTLAYRKRMVDSPAYRLNHEEVIKALEEGHRVRREPRSDRGGARRVRARPRDGVPADAAADGQTASVVELPARTVLVAAGTVAEHHLREGAPRHVPARQPEEVLPGLPRGQATATARFALDAGCRTASSPRTTTTAGSSATTATTTRATPATSSRRWRRPSTAIRTWCALFADELAALDPAAQPAREARWQALVARLDDELLARVERVVRLTPTIVEVIVRAPAAARHFHPGQFYRLQNFERLSPHVRTNGHRAALLMEGIALTGAWVDREGPAVADRAGDGRVEPAVCVPAAGRAGGGDGPDRHADRDSRARQRAARRRRPRQRRAVLDRQGAEGAAATA